jgi:3-hydroxybutyrate dehydrogenase
VSDNSPHPLKEPAVRLKDKVAIITGAASGIGKEIAILFAREGAKVAIADLDQKAADAAAKEIDPSGKRAIGVAMDVASEEQVEAGTGKTIKTFGGLDVLVSNAGIQVVAPNPSRRGLPHDPFRAAADVQTE